MATRRKGMYGGLGWVGPRYDARSDTREDERWKRESMYESKRDRNRCTGNREQEREREENSRTPRDKTKAKAKHT